jgi:hypothetical protein
VFLSEDGKGVHIQPNDTYEFDEYEVSDENGKYTVNAGGKIFAIVPGWSMWPSAAFRLLRTRQ